MASLDDFTMLQAKRDFAIGYMDTFSIARAPMSAGWVVTLKAGTRRGPLVTARGDRAREFKTLDAAVSALEQIGFKVEGLLRG